ncbi:MAG: sigma-54-dependent transcriptional regulator [Candidatus Methylomirabilales bacterium]
MSGQVCKILIVDDEVDLAQALSALLGHAGYTCAVCTDGARAYDAVVAESPDLVLTDLRMPGGSGIDLLKKVRSHNPTLPVVLLTAFATVDLAVEAMREGATDFLAKPFLPEELLAKIRGGIERSRAREENRAQIFRGSHALWEVVAASRNPRMREVFGLAEKTAPTDSKVLITGESGTGKELVARLIHRLSPRRDRGFFPVNCAALTETLLESELFGHERGAFTGAISTRKGIFEVASDGTLFLDEIAATSGAFQAKLLRAVETGEFARVGGTQPIRSQARIIAATNTDLTKALEAGTFRGDLLYRLRVVHLALPPLRERPEDIPMLAEFLLRKQASRLNKSVMMRISDEALQAFVRYRWPGNIRELENVLERAVIVTTSDTLTVRDLPADVGGPAAVAPPEGGVIEAMERTLIEKVLAECEWNKSRAARRLGVGRRTLYSKAAKYGIRLDADSEKE